MILLQTFLLDRLDQEGLTLERDRLAKSLPAVSCPDYGTIVIDTSLDGTGLTQAPAHELSHFSTQAFHTLTAPLQTWGRCEAKTNGWMIRQLCPVEDIRKALDTGCRTYWELAEVLDVGAGLAEQSIAYYTRKGEI